MEKQPKGSGKSVLCVDDDDSIRPLLARILHNAGFVVIEAASCAAAQLAISKHTPDLVILDVDLGDGDGFDLAAKWRQDGHANLPILSISGREHFHCQNRAEQLKASFLPKPFTPEKLLASVQSLIKLR
jgi:DNA-binding response OmpR family regulator